MAKEKNNKARTVIAIVSVSIMLLGIVVAGVMAYGDTSHIGKTNTKALNDHKESASKGMKWIVEHFDKETAELKEDGCKPARTNEKDIVEIKTKLDTISAAQETKRKEDKESFKEILERLPK